MYDVVDAVFIAQVSTTIKNFGFGREEKAE